MEDMTRLRGIAISVERKENDTVARERIMAGHEPLRIENAVTGAGKRIFLIIEFPLLHGS
jgi:hypothetical protein